MKKAAMHHIVKLPLGYFSQNASGRLRKVIDDNAGLTENFLAHQLPDLTGAVVMPIAVIVLIFVFDWRLGICCLLPLVISVRCMKQMMGGDNANFMEGYMTAQETMNKEAVEYIRGIPVVKVFQQTVYSFKNFHAAIEEYEKYASGYALKCRIPLTGFNVALNGTFILLIPVACMILAGVSGQASYQDVLLDFLFYSLFTPICTTMMNRVMFAGEQLMAAKSAVTRIEEVLKEQSLPETANSQQPKDASIAFKDVSFCYPGTETKALEHISFEVPQGKTVALVGASGSGKTTLLNCISTIDRVSSGHIYVGRDDITKLRGNQLNRFRREELGFIFQDFNLLDTLTAYENIALALSIQNTPAKKIDEKIKKIAKELAIEEVLNKYPYQMSGGQKQRVASARAIITNPKLILADEPTGALDSKSAKLLLESLKHLNEELSATILMVTHDSFTASYAGRILFIKDGKVFHELRRGADSRKEFFNKIIDVVTLLGGDLNDAI